MSTSSIRSIDADTNKGNKKRKRSNEFNKTSETNVTNDNTNKKRIRKYCPDDASYELECEWKKCNYTSNLMDDYLKHIDDHLENDAEQSNSIYECQWRDCNNEEFSCEFTFKRHVRYHAFHTKLKKIGSKVLETLEEKPGQQKPKCNLDEQTRNLIPELPYKFECSWLNCDYSADNPELFYRHIRVHVEEYPKKLLNAKCQWNDCEQIIKDKNRLVEHMRHHSQEKLVSCPVCGALFSSFTKFIDHSSRTCDLRSLCFQCSHCNKKFATNNLLKEHIRKHINKTKCPICDMTCIDKNDLSKHILYKHTTHKAFKCDQCDHTCKTQNDLNKHINLKHNERFEYQCDECEFKTKDVNSMKRHMLKFHMNNENAIDFKDGQQFSCSYMCHVEGCNKVYCQGTTLSKHLKTTHNFEWPSGHSRFRYKLESDGFYRLQTVRYESKELVELLNKNNKSKDENESNSNMITPDLNLIQPDDQIPYLITSESNSINNTINNFNNNIVISDTNGGLIQISDFSTETSTSGVESINELTNKTNNNKIVYNGITYFNVVEVESQEKELDQPSSILSLENNINNADSFAQLETISNIHTDNQNKLIQNNNMNSRIDFDLENFFTNSSLLIKEPNLVNINNDLNNQSNHFNDLNKNESNMILDYNNTNDATNGLNSFKIFSIDRYIDDSRF